MCVYKKYKLCGLIEGCVKNWSLVANNYKFSRLINSNLKFCRRSLKRNGVFFILKLVNVEKMLHACLLDKNFFRLVFFTTVPIQKIRRI